ncbi:hypothetical protein ACHAWO_004978 [Cyclotella atomus]|uniref:Uncharacterized protein n=1 Tax=Cyclotella atomus TaxID=382360 RepID=A0ABD3PUV8_9STRA
MSHTPTPTSPSPTAIKSTLQQIRGDLFDMDSSNATLVKILDKVQQLTEAENEVVERQKEEIQRLNGLLEMERRRNEECIHHSHDDVHQERQEYDVLSSGSFSTTTTEEDAFEAQLTKASLASDISQLSQTKISIHSEIDTLRHQVSLLVEERTCLIKDIQIYSHIKEVSDELDSAHLQISELNSTVSTLKSQLELVTKEKEEADRQIQEMQLVQNESLRQSMKREAETIAGLEDEIRSLNAAVENNAPRERLGSSAGNSAGDTASVGHECDNVSVLFGQDSINGKREENRSVASADDASDHKSIRVHAEKLLYWANKAAERSKSPPPSVASGSYHANNNNSRQSIARHSVPTTIGLPPRGSSSKTNRALPPRPPSDTASIGNTTNKSDKENGGSSFNVVKRGNNSGDKAVIFNLDKIQSTTGSYCRCSTSPFSGNDAHSEFYLPKLGLACECGQSSSVYDRASFSKNPTALTNILRPWQCHFLSTMGIHTADQLLHSHKRNANDMSRKMKRWREENKLPMARSKECYVALMVWARTAKVVLRSIEKQKEAGEEFIEKPGFLDITCSNDAYTVGSVSTLGQMSSVGGRVHEMMEI